MFFGGGGPPPDTNEYYNDLGVSKTSSQNEIKKAYRKLALKYHPDKGGDQEKFKKITNAYEILGDPEKREKYNAHGKDAFENEGMTSPHDMFSRFFSGHPHHQQRNQGPQKAQPNQHQISVTLEDMYLGKTLKVTISRTRQCTTCKASGCKSGKKETVCSNCQGKGFKMMVHQIGPGMIQQSQVQCNSCKAAGKFIKNEDKCGACKGVKTTHNKHTLEVNIRKGIQNNEQIKFIGEGNEGPNTLAGDVIFIIVQKEHHIFNRTNTDLLIKKTIKLGDALCGHLFNLRTLDKRPLLISTKDKIIEPRSIWMIKNEGMPNLATGGNTKGNLYIQFEVEFPKKLESKNIAIIQSVLPQTPIPVKSSTHEIRLEPTDKTQFTNTSQSQSQHHGQTRGESVECQNCIM
jgi:DnaJ homolog subfamily A member 2